MRLLSEPELTLGLEWVLNELDKLGILPKCGHLVLELSRVIEERRVTHRVFGVTSFMVRPSLREFPMT
jgi:hypothetical protein